ncbi:MAG TPA: DUF4252 domain-containing protein [Cyclobacteriaceae bacterium]|nr:DUF4252 domain-containing protein [Cyclobacteriaceae bacterium]
MRFPLLAFIFCASVSAFAQSSTTTDLDKKYEGLSLYFYKNTLKMFNQQDNKEFDEMVKDIDKMKFLLIDKNKSAFAPADYKKLLKGYQSEKYEEMMTSRYKGKNLDVYIRQEGNQVKGTIILVNDSTNLYVLDILGRIALDKATALFKSLDESSDITQKIKNFATGGDDKKAKGKKHGVRVD